MGFEPTRSPINRVSIIYVILPEFGVIYLSQLQLHWPMRWLVVDLIIVTHFCPVYLSKILIVFKVFKIPFVGLFADFLGFHPPILLVEACTGFRSNNEFNLKTFCLHTKVCIQVFHHIMAYLNSHLFHLLLHFIPQGAVLLLISFYQL